MALANGRFRRPQHCTFIRVAPPCRQGCGADTGGRRHAVVSGKRDGVTVNIIHPGATETERFYQLLEQRSQASGKSVEQLKQEATAKDGLRRLGKPEDIAALVLFLCSEKARHIRGTAITVDGGSTVGYY